VIRELMRLRLQPVFAWMASEVIEEDSKSIGANSNKVFTLSALAQASHFR
jgi:hypothetical protein